MLNPQMKSWGLYELTRRQAEELKQHASAEPSTVRRMRSHMEAPLGRAGAAATPSSADRIGRFGITTR